MHSIACQSHVISMKTIFQSSCCCPAYQNIPTLYYAILDFKNRIWTGYWRPYKYLTPIQAIKGLYLLAWSHWWYCYGVCHIQIEGVILSQFLEGLNQSENNGDALLTKPFWFLTKKTHLEKGNILLIHTQAVISIFSRVTYLMFYSLSSLWWHLMGL